jgi:hypothetical protein
MVILEQFRKNIKFGLITTKKYLLQHLIADWKEKWELFFIWIELGPTVISDAGLITRVGFAALPKFYTDNSSNIQKLIYYWFPIPILCSNFTILQRSLQSLLQNREIRSHPLSTPQQPSLPAHGWSPRTYAGGGNGSPQMRQVEEWIARVAFSRKGRHPSFLSHLDVVLRRPRPASCTASWCPRRWHRYCLYRARWRIDRLPHRAHPRRRAGEHCIPYFPWRRLWSRRRSKPRIPEINQHANNAL